MYLNYKVNWKFDFIISIVKTLIVAMSFCAEAIAGVRFVQTETIPSHQLVPVNVYHLKGDDSAVLWVNSNFHQDSTAAKVPIDSWRKHIWQTQGYIIPRDSEMDLVDVNDRRWWFAIRYGGSGLVMNEGDGRVVGGENEF